MENTMYESSAEPMIAMRSIHKKFHQLEVLKGIDLEVRRGEVLAIIGPSGSGKSTLLRCLNRLETIDRGTIIVGGEFLAKETNGAAEYADAKTSRRICGKMGMVFQQFNLFPHMTVMENLLEAPVQVKKMKARDAAPIAEELLKKVGLSDKKDCYPSRLSGGQKQRAAIARALAMKPEIMLFDEPTSALDPELTGEVLKTMHSLAREHMTMIVVTHEMAFAREAAHKVVFMADGEIVEAGRPQEFFSNPRQARTRAFLKNML